MKPANKITGQKSLMLKSDSLKTGGKKEVTTFFLVFIT